MPGLWKKVQGNIEETVLSSTNFLAELRATRALLKFCEDHGYEDISHTDLIKKCLTNLEKGRISDAVENYLALPQGKEGFRDWWPKAKFQEETDDYAWAVFEGLADRWGRLMERRVRKKY